MRCGDAQPAARAAARQGALLAARPEQTGCPAAAPPPSLPMHRRDPARGRGQGHGALSRRASPHAGTTDSPATAGAFGRRAPCRAASCDPATYTPSRLANAEKISSRLTGQAPSPVPPPVLAVSPQPRSRPARAGPEPAGTLAETGAGGAAAPAQDRLAASASPRRISTGQSGALESSRVYLHPPPGTVPALKNERVLSGCSQATRVQPGSACHILASDGAAAAAAASRCRLQAWQANQGAPGPVGQQLAQK